MYIGSLNASRRELSEKYRVRRAAGKPRAARGSGVGLSRSYGRRRKQRASDLLFFFVLFVDAMVWQDDGRHWPYDQAVCGVVGKSTVKTGNQSVQWCSMAALHVANERLQRVRHCWKRKFSGSTAPDAWRTLVAGGSGTAACATACAGEIDEYECVHGCLQRNQSAVVAATQQAFERVYSGREWVRQSEPSDPLSGHGSSLNRTLEARLALMRTIHQVCIWCFLTPILLATSLLPATDDAH
jgi:hypothetical protein